VDPDPSVDADANPDPGFHSDADPPSQNDANPDQQQCPKLDNLTTDGKTYMAFLVNLHEGLRLTNSYRYISDSFCWFCRIMA
jgi:hypothetical protein